MKNYICIECGRHGATQEHHIVLKSQASYMRDVKMNIIELCLMHHTNSPTGIHHNEELNLKYKLILQNKLFEIFGDKKHFSKEEIQSRLECSKFDLTLICKKLCLYRFGYEREQLVRRLMGGRLYE